MVGDNASDPLVGELQPGEPPEKTRGEPWVAVLNGLREPGKDEIDPRIGDRGDGADLAQAPSPCASHIQQRHQAPIARPFDERGVALRQVDQRGRGTGEGEQQVKGGGGRDPVWVGGRQFRKSTVEGELAVNNHRKESINLVIRRRFSGDLLKADGDPKSSLREEGVYSINRRNELVWTMLLKAGEERKRKYTYTVLVPF